MAEFLASSRLSTSMERTPPSDFVSVAFHLSKQAMKRMENADSAVEGSANCLVDPLSTRVHFFAGPVDRVIVAAAPSSQRRSPRSTGYRTCFAHGAAHALPERCP